jgi:hypothetical protein
LSADDKPATTAPPPPGVRVGEGDKREDRDASVPNLEAVDSAWSDDEELDEDATTVARVPKELVALSRRGGAEPEKKAEAPPEKHEAITARPPPIAGEASVVVGVPHQELPKLEAVDKREEVDEEDEDEEDELEADDLDAGWDIEEERAAAADVAAGLDVEARRKASEARAAQRKEKSRAKKLAARDKRKAKSDAIRLKQKKPKKRSIPPPREPREGASRSTPPAKRDSDSPPTSREHPTIPPAAAAATALARRDLNRMVLFVALVVVLGALVIGLARR